MKRMISIMIFLLLLISFGTTAHADGVTDIIDKAVKLYNGESFSQAITELNFAIGQIHKKLIDLYKTTFPEAQAGFEKGEYESQAAGMAMLGGGISVARKDKNASGGYVETSLLSNSPMLSSVMMMFSNPMFLGEKEVVMINDERAIKDCNEANKTCEYQVVVENQVLLTFKGQDVPFATVQAYTEAYGYAKLKELLKK